RLAADRGDLLAGWAGPARLPGHHRPRLSGDLRHALCVQHHRAPPEPRERPRLSRGGPAHRFRGARDMSSLTQRMSALNRRRWVNFRANGRGYWSFVLITVLFVLSLLAEFIANDRPLLVSFKGELYAPVVRDYPETAFGGVFETPADY